MLQLKYSKNHQIEVKSDLCYSFGPDSTLLIFRLSTSSHIKTVDLSEYLSSNSKKIIQATLNEEILYIVSSTAKLIIVDLRTGNLIPEKFESEAQKVTPVQVVAGKRYLAKCGRFVIFSALNDLIEVYSDGVRQGIYETEKAEKPLQDLFCFNEEKEQKLYLLRASGEILCFDLSTRQFITFFTPKSQILKNGEVLEYKCILFLNRYMIVGGWRLDKGNFVKNFLFTYIANRNTADPVGQSVCQFNFSSAKITKHEYTRKLTSLFPCNENEEDPAKLEFFAASDFGFIKAKFRYNFQDKALIQISEGTNDTDQDNNDCMSHLVKVCNEKKTHRLRMNSSTVSIFPG